MEFISQVVYPSEHNWLQDDSNDANISSQNEWSPSPFYDHLTIPYNNNTNNSTFKESSDFDPNNFDKHKQQDATLQAKWHTRTMALQALNQLKSEPPLATGSNKELGDMTKDLSHIENIKIT